MLRVSKTARQRAAGERVICGSFRWCTTSAGVRLPVTNRNATVDGPPCHAGRAATRPVRGYLGLVVGTLSKARAA